MMISGQRPVPTLLLTKSKYWDEGLLQLFPGVTAEAKVRKGLERIWDGVERKAAGDTPAVQASMLREVRKERCEADFFTAVARCFNGNAAWVDAVRDVAGDCPADLEVVWASRAIVRRWR